MTFVAFAGRQSTGTSAAATVIRASSAGSMWVTSSTVTVSSVDWIEGDRLDRGRLVGAHGLAELRARLVAALPVVFGPAERLAGRLAAGRAERRGCAHARRLYQ